MEGPNWKLSDDLKTVTITFPTTPTVVLELDAAGVEDILKNLGEFRANMSPTIPPTFALGQPVRAVPNPRWATEPDAMMGDSLLHLRDPRFGWLHYQIPRAEAGKLAGYLQKQVDSPPAEITPGKAN